MLLEEDFEGAFPGATWDLFDWSSGSDWDWGVTDADAHGGIQSVWPAAGGDDAVDPDTDDYPTNLDTAMRCGPFDLSDAQEAELVFYYWLRAHKGLAGSGDEDVFRYGASSDGEWYDGYEYTGSSEGWQRESLDLAAWVGEPQVWIVFSFHSGEAFTERGVFVDDVLLQKYVSAASPG